MAVNARGGKDVQSQQAQRALLYGLLGDLPPRERKTGALLLERRQAPDFDLEYLSLDLNGQEAVPAYFIKPRGAVGRMPAVLFSHSHGGNYAMGKDELLQGNTYLPEPAYAKEFAGRGWGALCIDHWLFGERNLPGRVESSFCKEMLWRGKVPWGLMVYDSLKAVDYLAQRDDVDASRIGALGMSMGSTMSWWLAALDERIAVCVDICCLTDFDALIAQNDVDSHGIYYYVPGLLKHFSAAQINALIAPRPHLALAGDQDNLTPLEGLERIDRTLRDAYAAYGKPQAWRLIIEHTSHFETPRMRAEALSFLEREFDGVKSYQRIQK